ncbi:MATE family efflux transporter [Alteromonadaceae bacterium BrNp21-10]|nr:MATE family efflux transporter [Alteromonadaceae bacterium BrNp21-10]
MSRLSSLQNTERRHLWVSIAALAIPVAAQMMLQSFLGMADVLMVSDLGPTAIAAVGLAAKLHFLLLVLMTGIGAGCGILVAQYTGAKDLASGQKTVALSMLVGSAVMIPFTLAFAFASDYWITWITPDPEVAALAASYLAITALVLLITQVIVIYESALRALGDTGLPLIMGAISAAVNVLLNYVLIFGHWGFSPMGVEGAAWATLISRIIQLSGIMICLYWRKHAFALYKIHYAEALNKKAILHFSKFITPLVVNHLIWGIGNAAYHVLTGYAGTDALAVMGVIVPIESLFFSLFVGLSNASTVMIGRALGAGQPQQAWQLHRLFDRFTLTLVAILSIALWFSRPLIVGVFDELSPQTAILLSNTLGVFAVLIWVKILNMVRILGVLRAGGDNNFCLVTDTIVMWGIGIPIYCAAIFWGEYSFVIIYALMFVEDFAKFLPVRKRLGVKKWMNNLTTARA